MILIAAGKTKEKGKRSGSYGESQEGAGDLLESVGENQSVSKKPEGEHDVRMGQLIFLF